MNVLKVIFLGPAGVGKTTLKKIFFEYENPLNLLKIALEPTYGIETTQYHLGSTIAVHDLAGQQLEEWLSINTDIFIESNLILCILNSLEPWNTNQKILNKICELQKLNCPNAQIAVLFHKIDLLSLEARDNLRKLVKDVYFSQNKIMVFLTSITQDYFLDLYKNFLYILRKSILPYNDTLLTNFILSSSILSFLGEFNPISIDTLVNALDETKNKIFLSLEFLKVKKYIRIEKNEIFLTNIGKEILHSIKKRITIKLHNINNPDLIHIKGLILSDLNGRTFFILETSPKFWESILSNQKNKPEPALISMFLTAVRDFGFNVDSAGFSQMSLSGPNIQIITFTIDQVFGIYFLDIPKISNEISSNFQDLIKNLTQKFSTEIQNFALSGALDDLKPMESYIEEQIYNINIKILNSVQIKPKISKEKIIQIYQKIDTSSYSIDDKKELKHLLFNYALLEDQIVLDEIYGFLKKLNLLSLIN